MEIKLPKLYPGKRNSSLEISQVNVHLEKLMIVNEISWKPEEHFEVLLSLLDP